MNKGDYVRFDYHRVSVPIQIAKIIEAHYDNEDDSICYLTDIGLVIDESNLVKEPSPNIIDLIEVADYVNGYLVIERDINNELRYIDLKDRNMKYVKNLDIKSIVTKEQFSAMEYKVESEVK